ncbi:hypothetical protein EBS02_00925 [bacterium]|nr:hypothetical protein [bacterium]
MKNTYFPTGDSTQGYAVVCLEDLSDEMPFFESECFGSDRVLERLADWMHENEYCAETWQAEKFVQDSGYPDFNLSESEGAFATLDATPGMGPVTPPQGPGTNQNFYDVAKQGSGDKFPSLTVGTPAAQYSKKKKITKKTNPIQSFSDFIQVMKKFQGK